MEKAIANVVLECTEEFEMSIDTIEDMEKVLKKRYQKIFDDFETVRMSVGVIIKREED